MTLLCDEELGLLARAAESPGGLVEVQVAGPGAIAHFPDLVHATSLQLAGYLETVADAGPFARWRIKDAIVDQVREIMVDQRPSNLRQSRRRGSASG